MGTPAASRAPRLLRRALLALAAALLGPVVTGQLPRAHAHTHPNEITVQVNESVSFEVVDPGTCSAFVSASVQDTALATITPDFGTGISVEFTVTAKGTPGETNIIVSWVGEDVGGAGPCQEVSGPVAIKLVVTALPQDQSTASRPTSGRTGDPVDTFNGELYFHEPPDLDLGGDLPLRFQRYYASRLRLWFIVGDMGDNWRHSFEWRINNNGTVLHLTNERGKVAKYLKMGADWVLQNNVDTPYVVESVATAFQVSDPSTNLLYSFDAAGKLTEIADGKGATLLLTYDGETGKLDKVEEDLDAGSRRGLQFFYTDGKVSAVQETQGGAPQRTVYFTHDGENLVAAQDAAGKFTTYQYDEEHADAGLLLRRTRPEGNAPWTQTYDDVGKVAVQTDAYGNEWTFAYGPPTKPGVTKVTRPDGTSYTHKHDSTGTLIASINTAGKTVTMADDGNRRRSSVKTARGGQIATAYGPASGRVESYTDALGNTTEWTHAARTDPATGLPVYDLERIDRADGTFETFAYDSAGNLVERLDESGGAWTYTRDARGRVLTETNPRGGTTTYVYDGAGNLDTATDHAGNTTTYTYDASNRLILVTHQGGDTRSFAWNAMDRKTSETDEEGTVRSWSYDDNGNLVSVTGRGGDVVTYSYDLMDRLVGCTDALGNVSNVTWDDLGRFATKSDRRGEAVANVFDARDLLVSATDQEGNAWTTTYDDDGNIVACTDPLARRYAIARDVEGLARVSTTPAGRATRFSYDARNRLVLLVDGEDRPVARGRDPRGLVDRIDAGGGLAAADFQYDDNGLFTGVTDGNGNAWQWTRDDQGRHVARIDPLGRTTALAYDGRNRVSGHTYPGALGTLAITYDGAGRVTERAFSDGTTTALAWTPDGRPSTGTEFSFAYDAARRMSSSNGLAIARDDDGRVVSVTYGPGKVVTYAWDGRGRLASVSDWAGGGMTFTRDATGRAVSATRSNGVGTTWEYDADGHLTAVRHGTLATVLLARDGAGNVVSADRTVPAEADLDDEGTGTWDYDAAAQVDGITYDDLGRVTDDGTRTCSWELSSRLADLSEGSVDVAYVYDAFGNVVSRNEDGTLDEYTWNYAFDRPTLSVVERTATPLRYFVWAPDGTLLYGIEAAGNALRYHHFDEAGSTLFLTDGTGAIVASFASTPWGVPAVASGAAAGHTPFVWRGQWGVRQETPSGLHRMGTRLYDAATRRFLTRDDRAGLGDPVPGTPYAYASGDPIGRVDPLGETPQGAQAGGGVVDQVNFGANVVDVAAEVTEQAVDLTGNKYTSAGKATKLGSNVVGTTASVIGAGIEVYKGNERMDGACDRFSAENRAAREENRRLLAEAWDLYFVKKRISREQYDRFRRAIMELFHERIQRSEDNFTVDTLANGTITTLNLLTNLIPGGGLVIDWADHIQH
jgi:RHS repeat-associated protein